nr:putative F-box protein At1g67623 [Ipomoea batatas]GMC65789.1 putative F-box protein At1g67623 [Ipomoea batatas]GMD89918.1 putative F-box protein At1g67623 [Ipomoea batatas]GME01287.1 putative F-box protein At1g67623 [Ipomoea batatas]GME17553.1 putative F-box protein At1g67623 [Ipomoea batatas]
MFDEQGGIRRKRRRTHAKTTSSNVVSSSIHSLPQELVVEILAKVAAHSWDDLFNARLSCKRWNDLDDEDFVYKHMSLAKLPIVKWKPETEESKKKRCLFFQKCLDAGNLEALYRKGLVDYLGGKGAEDDALGYLKKAANAGHIASQYAVCIILIFLGSEHKENGIRMLSEMMSKESREDIRTAREKLGDIINLTWLNNFSIATKPVCCTKHYGHVKNSWVPIDSVECKFCKCDEEISHILKFGLRFYIENL